MIGISHYILQRAEKSHCPQCGRTVDLLARADGNNKSPWFYICWFCRLVAEVGKGEVKREGVKREE